MKDIADIPIDLKKLLTNFVPTIKALLGDEYENIDWQGLNKKYKEVEQERRDKYYANNEHLEVSCNFFDIVLNSLQGKPEAINLLSFFNHLISDLCGSVQKEMKGEVKGIVENLLKNFDYNYLNFLGELAVLNAITSKGIAKLNKVEFVLDNGKQVDFVITNSENETYQVEVVNINLYVHNKNGHKDYDYENHINRILTEKVSKKTHKLADREKFIVFPVLWAHHSDLIKIVEVYKNPDRIKIENTVEPFAFCPFDHLVTKIPEFKFKRITTLFEERETTRNLEPSLRQYLPALFELMGSSNLSGSQWRTINENFQKDYEKREATVVTQNYLRGEVTIYDLIFFTLQGQLSAFRMLHFLNCLFVSLNQNLPEEAKGKLRLTIRDILISFDHNYLNYIAELAVLDSYIKSGFTLVGIERDSVAGGRTADFTFYKDDKTKLELVEVVSVHFTNQTDLKRHLLGKINTKISDKIGGLETYAPFTLFPVFWSPYNAELLRLQEMFREGDIISVTNVHEPFAYCSYLNEQNELRHRFVGISNLFTEEIIQEIKATSILH